MKKYLFHLITLIILTLADSTLQAQTLMPYPTATSTYKGMSRGYFFTAPCNFTIVGLKVPTNLSTDNSWIAVMDFGTTPPPVYSATTNSFTTLFSVANVSGTSIISVNIPILSGHVIGIMGVRGSPGLSMYSVAGPWASNIDGKPITLTRMGMQFDMTTTTLHDIWQETSGTVAVTEMYYSVYTYKNDVGISAIDSPVSPLNPSFYNVKASIQNFGKDTVKSVELGWSINGVTQTAPVKWTGNLAPNSTVSNVNIGSYNFITGTTKIKVWTKNPNSVVDSNAKNDTMTKSVIACNLLSGNYVIDKTGKGNYYTISDAVASLSYCGINGPVNFKVNPGTYYERVVIPPIPGASLTNTITIEGVSQDSVTVSFNATSAALNSVFVLNGADYITIKNLTIDNNNASYACGISLCNQADFNTIENCKIVLNTTVTSTTVNPIVASAAEGSPTTAGNSANYCLFKDNTLIGGYYGIKLYGASSAAPCKGNQLINNTISQYYYYGIYSYYQRDNLIQYNRIVNVRLSSAYGMYVYYNYNSVIDANYINTGAYGIYLYYNQNSGKDSSIVSNNIITNFLNGTNQMGIYNYYSYRMFIINNNIWLDGNYTSPLSYGCISNYYQQYSIVKNNILKSTGNLNCIVVTGGTVEKGAINYNNYVAGSTSFVMSNGSSTYKTLAIWKSSDVNQNENSIELEPSWVSKTDLHFQGNSPTMFGANTGLKTDFDGDSRCELATTIGADEYPYVPLAPTAGFVSDDTICINSPLFLRNISSVNDIKFHYWFLNGTLVSTSINYNFLPISNGIDTISLVTKNCFGSDTFTKQIAVGNTLKAPVSDFVANKNKAIIGETVFLNDVTIDCPSAWEWSIFPDSIFDYLTGSKQKSYVFVNGTNQFSQNPQVQFRYSDSFDISLKATNSLGNSSKYKSKYISIVASNNICFDSETEEPEGFLYDNGGAALNYSSNKSCSFYIHPCATNLSLTFSKMDIRQGDYLRIYDGRDKTGKALWNKGLSPKGYGDNDSMNFPLTTEVFSSQTGGLFIEFETDGSVEGRGFEAIWTSTPGSFSPPAASFEVPDNVCNGSIVNFENTSTGFNNKYYWDLDGNNVNDVLFTTNASWVYKNDGKYNARLLAVNCGGFDTFTKSVTVYTSPNKPSMSMTASNTRPSIITEPVNVSAVVLQDCIDTISWLISPSSYKISNGDLNSMLFEIKVNDTVCYDFTLITAYKGKVDTIFSPCFIRGIHYCLPNFSNFTKDVGISRVKLSNIDQSSAGGVKPFEDFTNTEAVVLQREVQYPFTVSRPSNNNWAQFKIWIDINIDGVFDDVNELVAFDTLSNSIDWNGIIQLPASTPPVKTRLRIGIAAIGQNFDACSILNIGEYEDYSVVITKLTTLPVITLNSSILLNINQCDNYVEPSAVAFDALGNNLTSSIVISGSVNQFSAGDYYIHYNVKDKYANKAIEVVRTVTVIPDNIPPVITLNGKLHDTLVVFTTYPDLGTIQNDNCSGLDKVVKESTLDNTLLGNYEIKYIAYDINGNSASVTRFITVIDNISPVINVFDPDTILLDVNTALNPRVLNITDNYYTTFKIVTSGTFYENFNTGLANAIGIYTVIYDVTDGSGNKASKTFWIKVLDKTVPEISLKGSRIISLCRFKTITEPGYEATDDLDPNPTVVTSGNYYTDYLVNFGNGWYEMKYTVTDFSGNSSSTFRIVAVNDSGNCASAINEDISAEVLVYPNPTRDKINIVVGHVQGDVQLLLFDVYGKIIYQENIQISDADVFKEVDLSAYSQGMYYLRVTNNGKTKVSKIIRN